ncbi:EamA family transporter [Solicola sp. PLA-1-18]|uniref:EamA family transporter n=1 Tax=Solicola sp. PLA-1-18 TaxID=3380532 RepID=UPI003B80712F
MSTVTNDKDVSTAASLRAGLLVAVVSSVAFGLSGVLASPLLDAGWSAGALVLVRIGVAAVCVLPLGVAALRGRWDLLRRNVRVLVAYGVLAVAGTQFCYFAALSYMEVGPALLIEYTAPAAVVVWWWVRHGQAPSALTVAGAALAATGLVLVLDVASGAEVSVPGVLWALGAMVGVASYFIISADTSNGLPPMVLAAGGLLVGALVLALLGVVGLMSLDASTAPVSYADVEVPSWLALVALGVVTTAVAYTTGIVAGRWLGSRLMSFVGLLEVVAAVGLAWLLLDQAPRAVQLVGGLLVLAGVVAVKLGERAPVRS